MLSLTTKHLTHIGWTIVMDITPKYTWAQAVVWKTCQPNLRPLCLFFSVLGQWRRKTFKKKNIEPIYGKCNEGNQIKKNNGQFARKLNEGDKIYKKLTYLKKIMGRREKQA